MPVNDSAGLVIDMGKRRMEIMQRQPVKDAKALLGNVPRHSVREVIAGKLAALISSGILSQGDVLPSERELAISLSVSRETVRGAIAILAERGVLLVAQGARTTVADADLSRSMAPELMPQMDGPYGLKSVHEARLLVECRIATEAARHATPQLLKAMRSSLAAQEACDGDPVRFLLADREFHGLLYHAAGNDVLADIAMSLHTHLLDHRRRIIAQPGAIGVSIEDHRAIVSAVERRDAESTVTAVSAHATRIYETTCAFLECRPD